MRASVIRVAILSAAVSACEEKHFPTTTVPVPASVTAVSTPPASATVGTSAGALTVKVVDEDNAPLSGVLVSFAVSRGSGTLSRASDTTQADGTASSTFLVGTAPGQNDVSAFVNGLPRVTFTVSGVAGAPRSMAISVRTLRFLPTQDSLVIAATARDTFGNASSVAIVWTVRDTTLLSTGATAAGNRFFKVKRRPGTSFIVATGGAGIDSIPVAVTDSSTASAPCLFGPAATVLAVGGTLAGDANVACIRATTAGAEYAVVAHLNTVANNVAQSIEVFGDGVTTLTSTFPLMAPAAPIETLNRESADLAFERRMRLREAVEIGPRVPAARDWFRSTRSSAVQQSDVQGNAMPSNAIEGTTLSLNVNAREFCSNASLHSARIVAVTDGAVVMADVDNPAGGFTDEEYRAFGVAMDTLVNPVDTAAFGSPTDIDGNRRVGILFTRAVNDLTEAGSPDGVVLGYYYLRDLLPQRSAFGDCPGSNVGEMFYILVPDPAGEVHNNVRTKDFVQRVAIGTIAHEYQHLINASRRMYVNDAQRVDEEVWLNEGLSHIAEELVFHHAAGTTPRQNIGGSQLALGTPARFAFDGYMRANLARYREFQRAPETTTPLAGDDKLATRGATWAFLRYLADRVRPSDGDFWRQLVNSRITGVMNLDSALAGTGVTTLTALRDWSVAAMVDDNPATAPSANQQASWDFVSTFATAGAGLTFALAPRPMFSGLSVGVGLIGGGSTYWRFGVPQGQDAFIRVVTFAGTTPAPAVKLTIVRIK